MSLQMKRRSSYDFSEREQPHQLTYLKEVYVPPSQSNSIPSVNGNQKTTNYTVYDFTEHGEDAIL